MAFLTAPVREGRYPRGWEGGLPVGGASVELLVVGIALAVIGRSWCVCLHPVAEQACDGGLLCR